MEHVQFQPYPQLLQVWGRKNEWSEAKTSSFPRCQSECAIIIFQGAQSNGRDPWNNILKSTSSGRESDVFTETAMNLFSLVDFYTNFSKLKRFPSLQLILRVMLFRKFSSLAFSYINWSNFTFSLPYVQQCQKVPSMDLLCTKRSIFLIILI